MDIQPLHQPKRSKKLSLEPDTQPLNPPKSFKTKELRTRMNPPQKLYKQNRPGPRWPGGSGGFVPPRQQTEPDSSRASWADFRLLRSSSRSLSRLLARVPRRGLPRGGECYRSSAKRRPPWFAVFWYETESHHVLFTR